MQAHPALQRLLCTGKHDDVELVTDAIDHVTPSGIVTTDGNEHPLLDVIVLATGDYLHGLEVVGRGGRRLHDDWTEPRPRLSAWFAWRAIRTSSSSTGRTPTRREFTPPDPRGRGARYVVDALQTMDRDSIGMIEVKDSEWSTRTTRRWTLS